MKSVDKKKREKVFSEIISVDTKDILSQKSELISVTKNLLTFRAKKKFFNLSENIFKSLNKPVELFLFQYEIPLYGIMHSIKALDGFIEVKVRFMDNTPLYYRECVTDLLN